MYFLLPILAIAGVLIFANPNQEDFANFFGNGGLKLNDINGGTFSSTGSFYSLDFTNYLYSCTHESEFYAFENGAWRLIHSDKDLFSTFISADIQNRNTGATITEFRADNFVTCDYPNSGVKSLVMTGTLDYLLFTGPLDDKIVKTASVPIPAKTLPDNVRVKVSQWKFTSLDIEKSLITNSLGHAWVSVFSSLDSNYVMTFNDNSYQNAYANNVPSTLRAYVSVLENVQPTVQDANRTNEPIFIDDVIQTKSGISVKGNTMDLNNGQQIKIKATMRNYLSTDGLPTVNIIGPNVNVKINLLYKSTINDNDGVFENNFLLPRDAVGQWNLKMTHPFRSTTSSASFSTIDSGIIVTTDPTTGTTTTTTNTGQIIPTSTTTSPTTTTTSPTTGATGGLTTPTVETKIHYINRYDKVPECSISTGTCKLTTKLVSGVGDSQTIQLNSLTDSISFGGNTGVEAILSEVQLTPVVTAQFDILKDIKRATKSDMIYQATLEPTGATGFSFTPYTIHSPQPNICFGVTTQSSCPPNAGMQLDVITISNAKLEQELQKHGVNPAGQKVKLTVQAIDGTFTVLDYANKEHLGSAKGTKYVYTFTYGATPVNNPTSTSSSDSCTSSDPKVGCECPTGQVLTFDTKLNKLACVDPSTGETTTSTPTSDPTNTTTEESPYCETNSKGDVIATFGNVSIDDPGCAKLFGEPDNTSGDNGQIEGDPNDQAEGSGTNQPLFNCEDQFGVSVCALASGNPSDLFSGDGVEKEDLSMTILGVIIAIIVIIIIIAVALKKGRSSY